MKYMNWEDLEVGDKVRIRKECRDISGCKYTGMGIGKNLKIIDIKYGNDYRENYIFIVIEPGEYHIRKSDGVRINYDLFYGPFFEIVELKEQKNE